jgi:Patatin-like phospholipase
MPPQPSTSQPPTSGITSFFRLLGLLKYGLVLSVALAYLPFTTYRPMPLHGMLGNLFSELRPLSAFSAMLFVLLAAWTVMIVTGLIVNGVEIRFPRSTAGRAYRTYAQITREPSPRVLPRWADEVFSVPVTVGQFVLFTLVLAALPGVVIVHNAQPGERLWALAAIALALVVAYVLLLLAAAPAAILDPDDPPLRGRWPGTPWLWNWLGRTPFRSFAGFAQWLCSRLARALHMTYILDGAGRIYPAHLLAAMAASGFVLLWAITAYVFYPARLTAASVVYLYVGLLIFVWFFGALSFHLGRWHISPLAAVALILLVGYAKLDHRFEPAEPPTAPEPSIDPIDVAAPAETNLVVVATAGGGGWAAAWTARALEQLIGNRPELRHEIRLISSVSGGSVGTAFFIDGLLRGGRETSVSTILHDVRVRSTASSLEAVAYGFAFSDFPRLFSGGFYNPHKDRGQLLEEEWARIAAAPIQGEDVGPRPDPRQGKRRLRSLNTSIRDGTIPAPIFGTTVMEAGQRLMITPITFAPSVRAPTLQEFLFGTVSATPEPDVDLWTAARLSATFTYISPPARSWLDARSTQKEHLIDGGYYDNYGVTSALDWLTPVLIARKNGDPQLRFKRVLLIELSGFTEPDPEFAKPADGLTTLLTGPTLTAFLALREGVATSRNRIDLDRFTQSWNEAFRGQVQIETVKFEPGPNRRPGPLSWHLSSTEIESLKNEWGPGADPQGWQPNLRAEWGVLERFLRGEGGRPRP